MSSAVKYQLAQVKKPILYFYAIVFAQLLLLTVFAAKSSLTVEGTVINGNDFATMIFIFVLGLNSFKENFFMFMQNSRSRKTLFLSYLASLAPVCGVMAVIDNCLGIAGDKLGLFKTLYLSAFRDFAGSMLLTLLIGILWSFCIYLFWALSGYLITNFYYRAGKGLKILVSVGVPGFLFVGLPLIDTHLTNGVIGKFLSDFLLLATGITHGRNPFYPILFALLFGAVFAACSYLLARRSIVKETV